MSAKIFEIAGALHKGTQQVITDLQAMGVTVSLLSNEVADEFILALAELYGRRENVLRLLSNEFIYELEKRWSKEELLKFFPQLNWEKAFLKTKDAERILILKECLPGYVETVENHVAVTKTAKMQSAYYLAGKDEKAILVPEKARDMQVFLIPQNKKETEPCCLCFDRKKIVNVNLHVQGCMLLVWADGKYFYEPAAFTKMQGRYYLELYRFFEERNIELPKYTKIHWSSRGFDGMTKSVMAGDSGFAVQEKLHCVVKTDESKLQLCKGKVKEISWSAVDSTMTIKGNKVILNAVREILEKKGEMGQEELGAFEQFLRKTFTETVKLPKIYLDHFLNAGEEEKLTLKVEAYERLKMLEEKGLSKEIAEAFGDTGEVFVCRKGGDIAALKGCSFESFVKRFETQNRVIVYLAVFSEKGRKASVTFFTVSDERYLWRRERENLLEGKAKLYVKNLSEKREMQKESIQFCVTAGGIECLQ